MMKFARAQRQDALPLLRLYRLCANQPQSTWNEYYPSPVEVREDLEACMCCATRIASLPVPA